MLRGDNEPIVVGADANVQDNCVCHTDLGFPLTIGPDCTIGHAAILHGCTIGEGSLIGMGATVLNGAAIGAGRARRRRRPRHRGQAFPDGTLVVGRPAKVARSLTEEEIDRLRALAPRPTGATWPASGPGFGQHSARRRRAGPRRAVSVKRASMRWPMPASAWRSSANCTPSGFSSGTGAPSMTCAHSAAGGAVRRPSTASVIASPSSPTRTCPPIGRLFSRQRIAR